MKYCKYFLYLLRHKWYVFVECYKQGLIWRGIVHDLSKFLPSEYFAYTHYYYGTRDIDARINFNLAWLMHQHRNKHHYQYWILRNDSGALTVIEMPEKYRLEMVCDWIGAGKAQGKTQRGECRTWYLKNKANIVLHPHTQQDVEKILNI